MIAIASDHGGYDLKETIKKHLEAAGYECKDFGCYEKKSCDYPVFGRPASEAVGNGECEKGILVCTTGIGMSMVANKVKGVRAALCSDTVSAGLTREHNNANMLVLGAGIVGENLALSIVDAFMKTEFPGEEKHVRRVNMIEG